MQRRVRRFFASLSERSTASYANIATATGFCNIELIIIKATAVDDLPVADNYIYELLTVFSVSPSSLRAFSLSFTRRFGKTRCWRVALKCLILLHRLLRSVPEDSPFRSELIWTRYNGLLTLHPCHFRDDSSSSGASEHYTAFIRSYAQLLDEALNCYLLDTKLTEEDDEEDEEDQAEEIPPRSTIHDKMKKVGRMLEVLPQLQNIIDRVMDCKPRGSATRSVLVRSAMKHIVRDSFMCYIMFRKEIVEVLENLLQMPYGSCISAFGVYKKAAVQANQLCEFYEWCKDMGICGFYEYPFVDRIPHIQIQALEAFLSGMWQMTPSSSSPVLSRSSSESTLTVNEDERQLLLMDTANTTSGKWENFDTCLVRTSEEEEEEDAEMEPLLLQMDTANTTSGKWESFEDTSLVRTSKEDEAEMEPLIKFEDDDKVGWDDWEVLLEASVNPQCTSRDLCVLNHGGYDYGYGNAQDYNRYNAGDKTNQWNLQIYHWNPMIENGVEK